MKVQVRRDQAVWERSEFEVEIPDGLEGDALTEALLEEVTNYDGYGDINHSQEILDEPVYGINIETVVTLPDGKETDL